MLVARIGAAEAAPFQGGYSNPEIASSERARKTYYGKKGELCPKNTPKKFVEHIQKDEALRKKVNDASAHIIKLAKDHGYEVTHEEVGQALKEHWGKQPDEPSFFSEAPGF